MSALLRIEWPDAGKHRIREVISRARAIPTGKHWSTTLARQVHWESDVECDGQVLADACPAIDWYAEQPCRISFEGAEGPEHHVPDLYLEGAMSRPWLIEFKDDTDRKLPEAIERARILRPPLAEEGYEYEVVVASSMRRSSHLSNAEQILRYGRMAPNDIDIASAERIFRHKQTLLAGQFLDALQRKPISMNRMFRLVLKGYISIPMEQAWSETSVLTWQGRPDRQEALRWLRAAYGLTK